VPFPEMIELYSRAKVVLGVGGVGFTESIKHLKGRDFEVPMSGALYLTSFNPELADHFVIGKEILCYASWLDCAEVIRWVLEFPEWAEDVRRAGRRRCLADHTWDTRIDQMLTKLVEMDSS
jgi:spore maturation protein CgeB